jgi:pimeloyl-ACP methyl ester carboxylesterase
VLPSACTAIWTTVAARCGAQDLALRGAAAAYKAADHVETVVVTDIKTAIVAPLELGAVIGALSQGRLEDAANFLTLDPGLIDAVMPYVLREAAVAQPLYADGHPVLTATGRDPHADAGGPPRSIADLMVVLARRDHAVAPTTKGGEIDVRRMTGPDGKPYVIVDIPGTKTWSLAPRNSDVTSLATNLRAIEGQSTTYERGVLDALRAAGVGPGDNVMLVGHSLGGMVAVQTAIDTTASGEFHITHVVTAGSPIGLSSGDVPPQVQVLALENFGDIVPHLDAQPNSTAPNVTTVTVHHEHHSVIGNHGVEESYLPGARDVDASDDPSIVAFRNSASGFLTASTVSTATYAVTRAP